MYPFRTFVAVVAGVLGTVLIVVACLVFGFAAFMQWLVTCTGPFYESGCDQSNNFWLNIGFAVTAAVLIAGAILTIVLLFRVLGRWVSPDRAPQSLAALAAFTAVLAVAAVVLVASSATVHEALREPTAWEEFNAPVVVDPDRCVAVPSSVIGEVTDGLVIGRAVKIGGPSIDAQGRRIDNSYRLRLDDVELSEWVAVATPVGHHPAGHWIAARATGTHSFASNDEEDWQPLNTFDGWVLFFKRGTLDSRDEVGIIWDDTHDYRARMTSLPVVGNSVPDDRDSTATLAACLGYSRTPERIGADEPWIWQLKWSEFSTDPTGPSITVTTAPLTTTPTMPSTTTTTTAEAPPVLPPGVVLLEAHEGGIDLLRGADTVPVLEADDVWMALPDYRGGVVFQRQRDWGEPESFELNEEVERWLPVWPEGVEPVGVEWIPEIGGPPQTLISGDVVSPVNLYDTALIDGVPTVIYERETWVVDPCDVDDTEDRCMWKTMHSLLGHLIALDLETGEERQLGVREGFEDYYTVSIGGDRAAILGAFQVGSGDGTVGIVDVEDLATLGSDGWVFEALPEVQTTIRPLERCGTDETTPRESPSFERVQLSPDGTSIALLEYQPPCTEDDQFEVFVVVVDVASGKELRRFAADHLADFDGKNLLTDSLVDEAGTHLKLPRPNGRYRFWYDQASDFAPGTSLTLRPDGLGPVDFGTPAEDTVARLAAALGPPTSDDSLTWDDPGDRVCNWVMCYEYARSVSWNDVGLKLMISDLWIQPGGGWTRVVPSFVGYSYGGSNSETASMRGLTPEGVGIGSTLADLEAAYGDAAIAEMGSCPERPSFQIRLDENETPYLGSGYWGYLSDGPIQPSSTILFIDAGAMPVC
jgi:hypothetical protein